VDGRRRLLLIMEEPPSLQGVKWALSDYEVALASDRETALAQVRRLEPPVVTLDLDLLSQPDDPGAGLLLLQDILAVAPDTKVIILNRPADRANAVRAIRLGAYDFCAKPLEPEILALTVERADRLYELQEENRRLHAVIMAASPTIRASDMDLFAPAPGGAKALDLRQAREQAERLMVTRALGRANGNRSKAAELLGVSRPTLYDLIDRFGLGSGRVPTQRD